MKCVKCGTTIKNAYYVDGKPYGVECFKYVMSEKRNKEEIIREERERVLNEIKDKKYIEEINNNINRATAIYEALKSKNMKKITNEYKIDTYNRLIEEYNKIGSLDNEDCSLAITELLTAKKDRSVFYGMYLELMSDDELIKNMYSFFMYWNEGIEDNVLCKFNYLIEKYEYVKKDGAYYINNTLIRDLYYEQI